MRSWYLILNDNYFWKGTLIDSKASSLSISANPKFSTTVCSYFSLDYYLKYIRVKTCMV